jgi:hypothetical protein
MFLSLASLIGENSRSARDWPKASSVPPCVFEGGATLAKSKSDLPPEALSELTRLFAPIGGLADTNEFFNASDVVTKTAPRARFIRAYHVRNIWIVWFERGGIALDRSTVALLPTADQGSTRTMFRATGGSSFHGNLCAGSKAFLNGARSGG